MATISAALDVALQHHQAGRLPEAEALYRQILETQPNHSDALYFLGLIAYQVGQCQVAVNYISQAIGLNPQNAEFHNTLGEAYRVQGKLQEAMTHYRQAVALRSDYGEAYNNFGIALKEQGKLEEAVAQYRKALALRPTLVEAYNNLGSALQEQDNFEEAAVNYRQALSLSPAFAEAHNNLGVLLSEQGKLEEAVVHYRQAVALKPAYVEAHNNLGGALRQQGKVEEAAVHCRQALALRPDYAEAYNSLGMMLHGQGKLTEAEDHYRRALTLKPSYAEAANNLGSVLQEQGKLEEAAVHCRQALALKPTLAEAYNNLGTILNDQGKLKEAEAHFRQALALKPTLAEAHNNFGALLKHQWKIEEAIAHYRQALALQPAMSEVYKNLGNVLKDQGKPEEAVASYRKALEIKPNDGLRILIATTLPVIAHSKTHLLGARSRFKEQIAELMNRNLSLEDPAKEVDSTSFFLSYQGCDDLDIQRMVSMLYEKACPSLNYVSPHCRSSSRKAKNEKIRIGFISRFFWNHTVGKLMRGIIAQLSRKKFSVTVFTFPHEPDHISDFISKHADRTVVLPFRLDNARHLIAQEQLDILFYSDIGMDPLTYFLAFSRLAPVQCVTWGHPVTTGIRNIDYFISSELLEQNYAEQHYGERLVRLRHLPSNYYKPEITLPFKSRSELGIEGSAALYVCPQSLFKLHPEFDELIAGILKADRHGQLILIEGNHKHWTELLMGRLRTTIPEMDRRVRFLPRLNGHEFFSLLAVADVILDPFHWSGGNSTYEALSVGTPIVTLPSEFMRGRVTDGCYKQMGVMDCVATTKEDYVKRAVRLGTDRKYRAKIKAKILAMHYKLYENAEVVRNLERFFVEAVEAAPHTAKKQA